MASVLFIDDTLAGVLFGLTSAAIMMIEAADLRVKRHANDQVDDAGTAVVFMITWIVAIGGSMVAAFAVPQTRLPGGWITFSVGVALTWLGVGLNRWARDTLGRAYRPIVTVIED